MILLDSNLFIIDRFFPRDALYPQNHDLIERLADLKLPCQFSPSWRFAVSPHLTSQRESLNIGSINSPLSTQFSSLILLTLQPTRG
jgi:hypothetical protein